MKHDIIIIGGGPGGYVAAIKAAQIGKKVCLIESDSLGGTCLNRGCTPTKALLKSVEVFDTIKAAESFGVTGLKPEEVNLNLIEVQKRKNEIVDQLVKGVGLLLDVNKVTVVEGFGKFIDRNTIDVNGEEYVADNIIIATGASPKTIDLENDDSVEVYDSEDVLDMDKFPKKLAIIGGGVIGIELAYYMAKLGIEIEILEFMDTILPFVDEEIIEGVMYQFENLGIKVHTGAQAKKIEKGKLYFESKGQTEDLECEGILMAVGREANYENIDLEKVGVITEKGAIVTDEKMQTNVSGIYAIGDVNGKSMLAHTASKEGLVAVDNINNKETKMNYDFVPNVIYITPEIASVGLTEKQAREKYKEVNVGKFPLFANGKAKIEGNDNGFVKIITEGNYDRVIGAHLYSIQASDMISELSLSMEIECTAEEIFNTIHPHPSVSEAIQEACFAATGKAIHY